MLPVASSGTLSPLTAIVPTPSVSAVASSPKRGLLCPHTSTAFYHILTRLQLILENLVLITTCLEMILFVDLSCPHAPNKLNESSGFALPVGPRTSPGTEQIFSEFLWKEGVNKPLRLKVLTTCQLPERSCWVHGNAGHA